MVASELLRMVGYGREVSSRTTSLLLSASLLWLVVALGLFCSTEDSITNFFSSRFLVVLPGLVVVPVVLKFIGG